MTGKKTQQRKAFGKNRRHHPSQTDLIEIFSRPRAIPHAVRQGLRATTATNLDLTEGWDAATTTGRDKLEDISKQQRPWMTTLKHPCTSCSTAFRLSDAIQDTHERSKTQKDDLEFLCTQEILFVSFVSGLEGVTCVTVDMGALGMADANQHLHCKTITLMANDPVVVDAFCPYRCERDHEQVTLAKDDAPEEPRSIPVSSVRWW